MLAAGESFGWKGFSEEGGAESAPESPEGDGDALRLVRIQRLYSGRAAFASGTTSLLTAE